MKSRGPAFAQIAQRRIDMSKDARVPASAPLETPKEALKRLDLYGGVSKADRQEYINKINQRLNQEAQPPGLLIGTLQNGFDFTAGIVELSLIHI